MHKQYSLRAVDGATLTNPARCPQCGEPLIGRNSTRKFCNWHCWKQWWLEHMKPKLQARHDSQADVTPTEADFDSDDMSDGEMWLARSRFWLDGQDCLSLAHQPGDPEPIILTGHGVQLRVEREALVVRDGFTHYPQTRREWRFYPGRKPLPSRIVLIDADGYLSMSVMQWIRRQNLPLIALNWQGEVVMCIGGDSMTSDFQLRQFQLAALTNGVGLELAALLLQRKVAGCMATLTSLPDSAVRSRALTKLDNGIQELQWPIPDVETLRMIEARAAVAYFDVWQSLPMHWKGTGRHPVPMDWLMVGYRSSLVSGINRHATHPANALLNYAYAVLESQVHIAATAAGFDPAIGYLHASRPGRVALAYDLMEPLRPLVDRAVLDILQLNTFTPSDFVLNSKGVCRLNPELARRVALAVPGGNEADSVVEWARSTLFELSGHKPDERTFKCFG